jgi:hypothetical protein
MDTTSTPPANHKPKKQLYLATDGSLKSCITAPLLELPLDFKAWPKSDTRNVVLFNSKQSELSEKMAFQDYATLQRPFRQTHSRKAV